MNEALQQSLYDKLSREQDKYRDWLKGQPPEEILHHSYEYTVREDILMSMEELTLSEAETRALLLSPSPMAILYNKFSVFYVGKVCFVSNGFLVYSLYYLIFSFQMNNDFFVHSRK